MKKLKQRMRLGLMAGCLLVSSASLQAQTVISGGGNYISGTTFYLGTHSGSPSGFSLVYDDAGSDAVKFHSNRIASWLWENPDGGAGSYPSMRLDQSNNLILYNGTTEGVKLNPVSKSLTLGGASGAILTANGTGLSTNGAFTVAGGFTNTNGSLTGGATGLSLSAGGTDQSIDLTPSGTGTIRIRNGVTPSLYSTLSTTASGSFALNAASGNLALQTSGSNRLYILSSNGNVGIGGITNPSRKLEVVDDLGLNGEKFIANFVRTSTSNGVFLGYRANTTAVTAALVRAGNSLPLTLGTTTTPEAFTILNSGNVGIGTTNPVAKLEVIGGANPFGLIVEGDGVSANARIALRRANATSVSATGNIDWIGNDNLVGARIGVNDTIAGAMEFKLGGSGVGNTKAIITSAGNVGIGTTSPQDKLQVDGGGVRVTGTGSESGSVNSVNLGLTGGGTLGSVYTLNTTPLTFKTTGVERIRIDTAGNVGIGTTNPNYALSFGPTLGKTLALYESNGTNLYGISAGGSAAGGADPYRTKLFANGTEAVSITYAGNVGIGTASPGKTLDVLGQAQASYLWAGRAVAGHDGRIYMVDSAGNTKIYLDAVSSSYFNSGNVGIGTTSPSASLDIWKAYSAGTDSLRFSYNDGSAYWMGIQPYVVGAGNVGYKFRANNGSTTVEAMAITGNGNVGIGTTSPLAKLSVMNASDFYLDYGTGGAVNGAAFRIANNSNNSFLGSNFYYNGSTRAARAGGASQIVFDITGASTGSAGDISFYTSPSVAADAVLPFLNAMTIKSSTGNVGIGTMAPAEKLDIASGNLAFTFGYGITIPGFARTDMIRNGYDNPNGWEDYVKYTVPGNSGVTGVEMRMASGGGGKFTFMGGNVGIGTTNPTHKLAVNGTVRAKEVIVDTGWADYVFEDDYHLAPLAEVESHIKAKKHLPGIPSAAEVAEHGVSMGDMQAKLLSKVEELTLHLIRMEKENASLRERVQKLEAVSASP